VLNALHFSVPAQQLSPSLRLRSRLLHRGRNVAPFSFPSL